MSSILLVQDLARTFDVMAPRQEILGAATVDQNGLTRTFGSVRGNGPSPRPSRLRCLTDRTTSTHRNVACVKVAEVEENRRLHGLPYGQNLFVIAMIE